MTTTTYDRDRLAAWRVRGTSVPVIPATPVDEPVDVEVFKLHSRITDAALDLSILPLYLQAAREFVESETQLACLTQTWRYSIDEPPSCGWLVLPMSPAIAVTSVTSYDTAHVGTVVLNTTYFLDSTSRPARLVLNDGISWPGGLRALNGIVVDYTAGYGTNPESVPARLRLAIYQITAESYERRELMTNLNLKDLKVGTQAMLAQLKVYAP